MARFSDAKFRPCFYVHHSSAGELLSLGKRLALLDTIDRTELIEKKLGVEDQRPKKVLAVWPKRFSDLQECAGTVDCLGGYYDYRLYDVDLRLSQRFLVSKGVFPLALVSHPGLSTEDGQYRINYRLPGLTSAVLEVSTGRKFRKPGDPISSIKLGGILLEGREEDIIPELTKAVKNLDPDIIYTANGDTFEMPHLARRAEALGLAAELQLGRERHHLVSGRKGKSYFSYGNILYKPAASILRGRLHIDMSSFIFSEGGFPGLADMARLSCLPLQTTSRISPGTAITAMQVQLAMRQGCAIMWKKNRPEDFKTAEELLLADRGGMIFEPEVGIHEGIVEVDFVSMYPNIMVIHNISPETLNCPCCPESERRVPELGYRICEKRVGIIPKVVKPLVQRRLAYKALAKSDPENAEAYRHRASLLKWTLVTCFGYTGYKNARFGRIECHESINAYGRDILIQTMQLAEKFGYDVLHGIIDSLWLKPNEGVTDHGWFCRYVSKAVGIPLDLAGIYRWLIFLPNKANGAGALNRYYGLFDTGELKIRGIFLRKSDTPELLRKAQKDMLDVFSRADNPQEFRARIPQALGALKSHAVRLKSGGCSLDELTISKRISRELAEYRQNNAQSAALRQLHDAGLALLPGQKVRYVFTDRGVKPADLLDGSEAYDSEQYLSLLCRAGEDLLLPFGWTEEKVRAMLEKS